MDKTKLHQITVALRSFFDVPETFRFRGQTFNERCEAWRNMPSTNWRRNWRASRCGSATSTVALRAVTSGKTSGIACATINAPSATSRASVPTDPKTYDTDRVRAAGATS